MDLDLNLAFVLAIFKSNLLGLKSGIIAALFLFPKYFSPFILSMLKMYSFNNNFKNYIRKKIKTGIVENRKLTFCNHINVLR